MATAPGVNQGKTTFVKAFFKSNPDGTLETVNKAWTAAGHEGTVSESLVGKVRARMGLTGKKAVVAPSPVKASTKAKPMTPTKTKPMARPAASTSVVNGSSAAITPAFADDDILDELEEDIDTLIHRIREVGGKQDVVKALRRARRLLFHSHEG